MRSFKQRSCKAVWVAGGILPLLSKCTCKAQYVLIVIILIKGKRKEAFETEYDYQECQSADASEGYPWRVKQTCRAARKGHHWSGFSGKAVLPLWNPVRDTRMCLQSGSCQGYCGLLIKLVPDAVSEKPARIDWFVEKTQVPQRISCLFPFFTD